MDNNELLDEIYIKVNHLLEIADLIKKNDKELSSFRNQKEKSLHAKGGNIINYEFVKTSETSYKVKVSIDVNKGE